MSYDDRVYDIIAKFRRVFRQLAILLFERFYSYEWDDKKNEANYKKHKELTFLYGTEAFLDRNRIIFADKRYNYGEARYNIIAKVDNDVLCVCFTLRGFLKRRLISVRHASRQERRKYYGNC